MLASIQASDNESLLESSMGFTEDHRKLGAYIYINYMIYLSYITFRHMNIVMFIYEHLYVSSHVCEYCSCSEWYFKSNDIS